MTAGGERLPGVVLSAEWRWLALLSFEVDEAALAPWVPRGTELDRWQGSCLASLVGFRFLDARLLGLPIPFHRHFDEVNLRFYLRRRVEGGWRRSVAFVRELVPRRAIAAVARRLHGERYLACRMRSRIVDPSRRADAVGAVEYRFRGSFGEGRVAASFAGEPLPLEPGSEEEFIAEHYWGHAAQRDGSTLEYRVEHPPWRIWTATEARAEGEVARLYGEALAEALARPPVSAFVAEGSRVRVRRGRRLPT